MIEALVITLTAAIIVASLVVNLRQIRELDPPPLARWWKGLR